MLLKSINLKSFLLLFFIGFSLVNLTANPPDGEDENTGSPFDSPNIKVKGGSGEDLCKNYFSHYFFTVKLENVHLGFPCDLHVGITSPSGDTEFIRLTQDMFTIDVSSNQSIPASEITKDTPVLYTAIIEGGLITRRELLEFHCEQNNEYPDYIGLADVPFVLDFYCNDLDGYNKVNYCDNYSSFEHLLGHWYDNEDCDLAQTVIKKFCCNHVYTKPSAPLGTSQEYSLNNLQMEIFNIQNNIQIRANQEIANSGFTVRNLSGQLMKYEASQNGQTVILQLDSYIPGIYLVSYLSERELITKKVYIQ